MPGLPLNVETWAAVLRAHGGALLVYQTLASAFSTYTLVNAVGDWFTFRAPVLGEAPLHPHAGTRPNNGGAGESLPGRAQQAAPLLQHVGRTVGGAACCALPSGGL